MNTNREKVMARATQLTTKPISLYCGQSKKGEAIFSDQNFACTVEGIGEALAYANRRDVQGESFIIREFGIDGKTSLLDDNAWQLISTLLTAGILADPTYRAKLEYLTYVILSFDPARYSEVTA